MDHPLCEQFGIDANAIASRLRLMELDGPLSDAAATTLHEKVICPNVEPIVERFYGVVNRLEDFNRIIDEHSTAERIRESQKRYLLGLGIGIDRRSYFEERLRIGAVHHNLGVPQTLYLSTFQHLQNLLIEYIPASVRADSAAFNALLGFVLKITALDMSLAVESYCSARINGLQQSLESERGETQRLREVAITDWLTGLHNHSYSRRCLEAALEKATLDRSPLCVIMADLDHFKEVNDTYGHLVGDDVLRITASRMRAAARSNDEICRYGGEEFLLILTGTTAAEGQDVAERIRKRIGKDEMRSGNALLHVSLSLGIAENREGDTVDTLIERADSALYAAKAAGRNCARTAPL